MNTVYVSSAADFWMWLTVLLGFLSVISTIRAATDRIVAAIQAGPLKKPEPPEQTFLGQYKPAVPAFSPAPAEPQDDERAKLRRRMNGY
jgi:hypothetical protein